MQCDVQCGQLNVDTKSRGAQHASQFCISLLQTPMLLEPSYPPESPLSKSPPSTLLGFLRAVYGFVATCGMFQDNN